MCFYARKLAKPDKHALTCPHTSLRALSCKTGVVELWGAAVHGLLRGRQHDLMALSGETRFASGALVFYDFLTKFSGFQTFKFIPGRFQHQSKRIHQALHDNDKLLDSHISMKGQVSVCPPKPSSIVHLHVLLV